MKPLTKNILIGLAVAITIVLILLIILFVVMYVMLVIEKNEEHRKLGHCVPVGQIFRVLRILTVNF
ncbi:hypothetical protein CRE_25034 [Caenorhabditis remanei]|uniref:Uncharacterized protein n=1 Tax=Caenorhabditis remanei TaxID=31234 RepID=E3NUM3_CAERE|nr:hypothetical protein CRE_25034 [Caenorhabditis remanei]